MASRRARSPKPPEAPLTDRATEPGPSGIAFVASRGNQLGMPSLSSRTVLATAFVLGTSERTTRPAARPGPPGGRPPARAVADAPRRPGHGARPGGEGALRGVVATRNDEEPRKGVIDMTKGKQGQASAGNGNLHRRASGIARPPHPGDGPRPERPGSTGLPGLRRVPDPVHQRGRRQRRRPCLHRGGGEVDVPGHD